MDTKIEVWPRIYALAIYLANEFRYVRRKYGLLAMAAILLGSAGFLGFLWLIVGSLIAGYVAS